VTLDPVIDAEVIDVILPHRGGGTVNVGDRVRIERDETRYPSKGTWPQFRGRTGIIIEINEDRQRPHLTEYAVSFGTVTKAPPGQRRKLNWCSADVAWFKSYEMTTLSPLAPVRHADGGTGSGCTVGSTNPTKDARSLVQDRSLRLLLESST
jgi:hypothetical protein